MRELNSRLSNLRDCADTAPEGTYERAKQAAACLNECADSIFAIFKQHGFKLRDTNAFRDVEASLYGLMLDSNPEEYQLITAEGFGSAMSGPARDRVLRQTERDRDALNRLLAQ